MTTYRTNVPTGPGLPPEVLAGSAVARALYARRGCRDGLTVTELASALFRPQLAVTAQLRALIAALGRLGSPWQVWEDAEADAWGLAAPHCPRPPQRVLPALGEPDLVSFDDLRGEFER